jgi:transitional endoplasmic reticulum ATPase
LNFRTSVSPLTHSEDPLTPFIKISWSTARRWNIKQKDVVKVSHNKAKNIFLRACYEENYRIIDDYKNNGKINTRTAALFGGVDYNSEIVIESASLNEISVCQELKLSTSANGEMLKLFLKNNDFIVHPITELVEIEGTLITFNVETIYPSLNSALVDSNTEIIIIEMQEVKQGTYKANGAFSTEASKSPSDLSTETQKRSSDNSDGESDKSKSEGDAFFNVKKPMKSFKKDVLGMDYIENKIQRVIELYDPRIYQKVVKLYGEAVAKKSNSILLYGPPGCGKTLVAEAIANKIEAELDPKVHGAVSYIQIRGSEIVSKYSGDSEKNVAKCFSTARQHAKEGFVILFIDEIETLIPDRSEPDLPKHDRALTNQFLQEMNDLTDNMLVIGATNLPFMIDSAASRRFVTQIFIRPAGEEVLKLIWKMLLNGPGFKDNIDFEKLARATEGSTPAEITDEIFGQNIAPALIEKVVRNIENSDPEKISYEEILQYVEKSKPTTVLNYVSNVCTKLDKMAGYPELKQFVEENLKKIN